MNTNTNNTVPAVKTASKPAKTPAKVTKVLNAAGVKSTGRAALDTNIAGFISAMSLSENSMGDAMRALNSLYVSGEWELVVDSDGQPYKSFKRFYGVHVEPSGYSYAMAMRLMKSNKVMEHAIPADVSDKSRKGWAAFKAWAATPGQVKSVNSLFNDKGELKDAESRAKYVEMGEMFADMDNITVRKVEQAAKAVNSEHKAITDRAGQIREQNAAEQTPEQVEVTAENLIDEVRNGLAYEVKRGKRPDNRETAGVIADTDTLNKVRFNAVAGINAVNASNMTDADKAMVKELLAMLVDMTTE